MMIDSNKKVWLLEVNAWPSLAIDADIDREVKSAVIKGVLEIVFDDILSKKDNTVDKIMNLDS